MLVHYFDQERALQVGDQAVCGFTARPAPRVLYLGPTTRCRDCDRWLKGDK